MGLVLQIDGQRAAVPTETRVLTDAVHHRTSVVIFGDVPASTLDGDHELQMLVPSNTGTVRVAVTWRTPVAYPGALSDPAPLSLGLILSLAAEIGRAHV